MGMICGGGEGGGRGSTHEIVRDGHVFVCLCVFVVCAVYLHLARCRLFMG